MLETVLESFQTYYGLDWMAFLAGLTGTYLITKKYRIGFLLSSVGCLSGLFVAAISLQFGFIVSNALMIGMFIKGFREWGMSA